MIKFCFVLVNDLIKFCIYVIELGTKEKENPPTLTKIKWRTNVGRLKLGWWVQENMNRTCSDEQNYSVHYILADNITLSTKLLDGLNKN